MASRAPNARQVLKAAAAAVAPSRDHYHHGDLPAALKRAALTLIGRHGAEGFSLRQAAIVVGVSPSAAYRHFEDKSALLGAIAADGFVELAQRFDEAMRSVRGRGARAAQARFLAQGRAYVAFALEQPERFSVMFGPYDAGLPCVDPLAQSSAHDGPYGALSGILDELLATGVISPQRRAGAELLVWSAIHGLATLLTRRVIAVPPEGVDAMVQRVGMDCLRALATPTSGRKRSAQ